MGLTPILWQPGGYGQSAWGDTGELREVVGHERMSAGNARDSQIAPWSGQPTCGCGEKLLSLEGCDMVLLRSASIRLKDSIPGISVELAVVH